MSAEGGSNPASRWCTSSMATLCVMKRQKSKPIQEQTRTINLSRTWPPSPPRCSLPGPGTSFLCPDCPVVLLGVGVGGEAGASQPHLLVPPPAPPTLCPASLAFLLFLPHAKLLPQGLCTSQALSAWYTEPGYPDGYSLTSIRPLLGLPHHSHPTLNGHRSLPPELLPPHFPMTSTWLSA